MLSWMDTKRKPRSRGRNAVAGRSGKAIPKKIWYDDKVPARVQGKILADQPFIVGVVAAKERRIHNDVVARLVQLPVCRISKGRSSENGAVLQDYVSCLKYLVILHRYLFGRKDTLGAFVARTARHSQRSPSQHCLAANETRQSIAQNRPHGPTGPAPITSSANPMDRSLLNHRPAHLEYGLGPVEFRTANSALARRIRRWLEHVVWQREMLYSFCRFVVEE